MALFNYATKEITLKIVYYGPGLSGKTTNLQHLHAVLNPETKGKLLSLSTESDRTLFFDFLPIELGKIREFSIRFQLYTVPGQVRYNATRKVVLKGADAVVFVADSQKDMRDQNIESFENMRENLVSNNINADTIPIILQYNKRDLKNILSLDELNQDLNQNNKYEILEATAINGTGVEEAFKRITKLVLKDISKKHKIEIQPVEQKKEPPVLSPVIETAPEPIPQPIPEPEKITEKQPVLSAEQVFEVDAFEFSKDEFGIASDHEADAIELIEEAEPLEEAYEAEPAGSTEQADLSEVIIDIPAPKQVHKEPEPAVSTDAWTEMVREAPGPEKVPIPEIAQQPFPVEKIEGLADELARVSGTLSRIADAISALQKSVSDLKGEVALINNEMALSRERSKEPELKDTKEFRELRREQKEISDLLRDVSELLGSIKEKKSWFKL